MISFFFAPARVHSEQHGYPVLSLGSACARVKRQDSVGAVVLAGEQRCELLLLKLGLYLLGKLLHLVYGALVILLLGELYHRENIVVVRFHAVEAVDGVLILTYLLLNRLRLLWIVPEFRLGGFHLKLVYLDFQSLKVQRALQLLDLGSKRFHG